jgi:hypothetical protein
VIGVEPLGHARQVKEGKMMLLAGQLQDPPAEELNISPEPRQAQPFMELAIDFPYRILEQEMH